MSRRTRQERERRKRMTDEQNEKALSPPCRGTEVGAIVTPEPTSRGDLQPVSTLR